jgi:hypothetical protein
MIFKVLCDIIDLVMQYNPHTICLVVRFTSSRVYIAKYILDDGSTEHTQRIRTGIYKSELDHSLLAFTHRTCSDQAKSILGPKTKAMFLLMQITSS